MGVFLKASLLVILFFSISSAKAQENTPSQKPSKETAPPISIPEPSQAVTLEEATKQVMQDSKNKVLAAKTEVIADKKIHVIKILTSAGHIQYIKIDAATGDLVDTAKK